MGNYEGRMPNPPISYTFFTKGVIIAGIFTGIILALISNLMLTFGATVLLTNTLFYQFVSVLSTIGFTIVGLFLIIGGIANNNIDKFVRLGMIIAGSSIIVLGLNPYLSISMSSLLRFSSSMLISI